MRQKSAQSNGLVEKAVRDIRRKTRRRHSTEEKIHIVLEGLRGEEIIRLVERSHIGGRPTLAKLGIPKTTFYRRYDRYLAFGRVWFYLSIILDDYSRYIIACKLCTTMKTKDVTDTLKLALQASGFDRAKVIHKPRLLSDNGSSYISDDLAEWLAEYKMDYVRGAPYHPQTQGKIERWHQTLKNRILLENYYLPRDLEKQIGQFLDHYNNRRYHESLSNVTPAEAYLGRDTAII